MQLEKCEKNNDGKEIEFIIDRCKPAFYRLKNLDKKKRKSKNINHSLFGCDYPVPAEFFKVHCEFISATPSLLAGLVAIESHVSLDPGASSRIEFLHLHLEIRRVLGAGISLDQSGRVPAMIPAGSGDLQGYTKIVPGMFEPLGHHSSELDRDPTTPSSERPRVLRGERWTKQGPAGLSRPSKNPLQRDRHRTSILAFQIDRFAELRGFLISPYPQGQFCSGNAMLNDFIGEFKIQHV